MTSDAWVVTMPKLGETVTEGTVNAWLKNVGDTVAFDDPLFEVSTDKVDSEIPSPYDGTVLEILVGPGETVPVGTPLVRIGEPGAGNGAGGGTGGTTASPAESSAEQAGYAGGDEGVVTEPTPAQGGPPSAAPASSSVAASPSSVELHEVTMPKLGETVTEGTVNSWLKNVGDTVAFDDPLFEVSTDKVDSEIPSPYDGTIVEILVGAGETVPVGTPLVRIGEPGAASGGGSVGGGAPATTAAVVGTGGGGSAVSTAGPVGAIPAARPAGNGAGIPPLSPVVRRLAAEHGLDLSSVAGTGLRGRITRDDVEQAISAGVGGRPGPAAPAAGAAPAAPAERGPTAPAAPPAPAAPAAAAPAPAAPGGASYLTAPVAASTDPRDEVVPLSRMRLLTADLMVRSLNTSAHVWTSVEVDFDAIEQVRRKHKDSFKKETGASLTYLPFVARAAVEALRAFPSVNASIDVAAKTMTLHPYVNLAVAVDLDEQGLVAPVLKDADALNLRGIAGRIRTLAAGARDRKLSAADMSGSTFTITNPGPFGSYASSPVINQPNVAILCTDGVTRRPVAVGDAIAIHPMGIIGLVYDHRAFDGSTASKFLLHLRTTLEQRNWEAEVT